MRNNENGFSIIEGLLILALVGLISFASWHVWRQNHAKKSNSTSQSSAVIPTAKAKNGLLDIPEWAASFKYDDSNATLQYKIDEEHPYYAGITSKELASAYAGKCDLSGSQLNGPGIGHLLRGKPAENVQGDTAVTYQEFMQKYPTQSKKIGEYIYLLTITSQPCKADATKAILSNPAYGQAKDAVTSIFK